MQTYKFELNASAYFLLNLKSPCTYSSKTETEWHYGDEASEESEIRPKPKPKLVQILISTFIIILTDPYSAFEDLFLYQDLYVTGLVSIASCYKHPSFSSTCFYLENHM